MKIINYCLFVNLFFIYLNNIQACNNKNNYCLFVNLLLLFINYFIAIIIIIYLLINLLYIFICLINRRKTHF